MMKVLLVDDHALFRDGLVMLLQRLDPEIQVLAAANCAETFSLLKENQRVDLVLLDLGLPDVSGVDGLKILRKEHPDIPIVVLSGASDSKTVRAAIQDGAMGFIPKTHSSDLILGALRFVLVHKGIYLPPELLYNVPSEPFTPSAQASMRPAELGLTARQSEVLQQLLEGKSNKAIARTLHIEEPTVKAHVNAVLRALKVTTRTAAVIAANRLKLTFGREL